MLNNLKEMMKELENKGIAYRITRHSLKEEFLSECIDSSYVITRDGWIIYNLQSEILGISSGIIAGEEDIEFFYDGITKIYTKNSKKDAVLVDIAEQYLFCCKQIYGDEEGDYERETFSYCDIHVYNR